MRSFGADEPMGCYDDLENADAFVLWGANMAEMHPILWSRLTDTRLTRPGCEVHVLSTFEHRSFELADNGMVFVPQTDLAILNYIANYIIQTKSYNQGFIDKHVNFTQAATDIGYGLRPTHALEKAASKAPLYFVLNMTDGSDVGTYRPEAERILNRWRKRQSVRRLSFSSPPSG